MPDPSLRHDAARVMVGVQGSEALAMATPEASVGWVQQLMMTFLLPPHLSQSQHYHRSYHESVTQHPGPRGEEEMKLIGPEPDITSDLSDMQAFCIEWLGKMPAHWQSHKLSRYSSEKSLFPFFPKRLAWYTLRLT